MSKENERAQILTHIRLMLHPYRNQFRKGLESNPKTYGKSNVCNTVVIRQKGEFLINDKFLISLI